MKIKLFIALCIVPVSMLGQQIENFVLDNTLGTKKELSKEGVVNIDYKVWENKTVLRREGSKVQLYSFDLKKVWEVQLPEVDEKLKKYVWTTDNNSAYIVQFADTDVEPRNGPAKLHRIDLEGNLKTVDYPAEDLVKEVSNVIVDNGFVYIIGDFLSNKKKAVNLQMHSRMIHKIDTELETNFQKFELPTTDKKYGHSIYHNFFEFDSGIFSFVGTNWIDKDGKDVASSWDRDYYLVELIEFNTNFEITNREVEEVESFIEKTTNIISFDTTQYSVFYDGFLYGRYDYASLVVNELIVMGADSSISMNINQSFRNLLKGQAPDSEGTRGQLLQVVDVKNDVVNGGLLIWCATYYSSISYLCSITIGPDLKVKSVYKNYTMSSVIHSAKENQDAFFLSFVKVMGEYKTTDGSYKKNIFDVAAENPVKSGIQHFLPCDTYQLLINDDFKSTTTTVYRIQK